jgi:hypothetical protein
MACRLRDALKGVRLDQVLKQSYCWALKPGR